MNEEPRRVQTFNSSSGRLIAVALAATVIGGFFLGRISADFVRGWS
jgi:hypothetical protein